MVLKQTKLLMKKQKKLTQVNINLKSENDTGQQQ